VEQVSKIVRMGHAKPRHPINFVSQRTGLSAHLIRAWERRHQAVSPSRSNTNRRLFSDAEIDRLKILKRLVDSGHSIGQIAGLTQERLEAILDIGEDDRTNGATSPPQDGSGELENMISRCQAAVLAYSPMELRAALAQAQIDLPQITILEGLLGPMMDWIGEEWHNGTIRVAQEHMASAVVRDFLGEMRQAQRHVAEAPGLIATTPTGEWHEFGALMAAAVAAIDGWRDIYLGCNLPAQEIAGAVQKNDVQAVALSISFPGDDPRILAEAKRVRTHVSERVPVLVGGAGAVQQRAILENAGLECIPSLEAFRAHLTDLRGKAASLNRHAP
jgi:methanogenic corrinoid protein MtbC1